MLGGVGWAATQLAGSIGSVTIFGTCSPGKKEAVIENGVTHPLNHERYEEELLKLSPQGVDIVIDNMAGSNFSTSQQLLKQLGKVVLIGKYAYYAKVFCDKNRSLATIHILQFLKITLSLFLVSSKKFPSPYHICWFLM